MNLSLRVDPYKINNHIWYYLRRAVGTFARALDCSSSIRQPSLHMSAAAASRDITLVRGHAFTRTHEGAV